MPSNSTQDEKLALPFGERSVWNIRSDACIASYLGYSDTVLSDVERSVRVALSDPIEFPSLDQMVVPGDEVVFAIDPALPALADIVSNILQWFVDNGTSPANIGLVVADHRLDVAERLTAVISERFTEKIRIEAHDPDDPNCLAYVAANTDADPIYLNRTLVDADVVIPIACCRPMAGLDYLGAFGLYPLLSDRATRGAFYRLNDLLDPSGHERLTAWADQAARWAGFMAEIHVIPAGADSVAEVAAGLTEPLERETRQRMHAIWETPVETAELSIALLDGKQNQDWLGVARALHAANLCTHHNGAIVICTEAEESLGKGFQRLRRATGSPAKLAEQLARETSNDALAASLVYQTTRDKHVYLVSKLPASTVESLGLGVIGQESELQHLINQFGSTLVLGSAQHRQIQLRS